MADPAPANQPWPARITSDRYFALVDEGVLHPDDRVELLEGVIVAMSPRNARHDAGVARADYAVRAAVGGRAILRIQSSLVLSRFSVPEPAVAVVPGRLADYDAAHPTTALLVIEVSDTSLVQDRLTKAAIYAAAGIPEYWLVNLRDDCVEVFRQPDRTARVYRNVVVARRGERLMLVALADASIAVDDLLPGR